MTVDGLSIEATSTAAETEVVNMVECGGNMVRTVANRGTCPGSRGNQPRESAGHRLIQTFVPQGGVSSESS